MKKRYVLIALVINLGSNIYAAQPDDQLIDKGNQSRFYCPETVACTKFNDPKSCMYKAEYPEQWGDLKYNEFILANTYKLDSVIASFHSPQVEPVTCVYRVNGYKNYELSISAKKESNLEIYYSKPSKWVFSESDKSYQGVCSGAEWGAHGCPLKVQPALILYNVNIGSGVKTSINNNVIGTLLTSQYGKVNYDTALNYCKGTRECRINIESSQGVFYGDVTADMYNNMKIMRVSSITPLADVTQMSSYNAVEVSFRSRLMH